MFNFDSYKDSPENIKDIVLEENRILSRKLAESQQSFELLKLVHLDKSVDLEKLNDDLIKISYILVDETAYRSERPKWEQRQPKSP